MKKKLVLSLDNSNLKSSDSLLIAGEWVLELNKNNLDNLNYEIFYSSSFIKEKRINNTQDSSKIYTNIIKDLYQILNDIHGVKLNIRSWKILLGPWLKRFIDICFQKDFLIKEILSLHEIDKVYGIKNDKFTLSSEDTLSIHPNSRDLLWNNIIFFKLLEFYKFKNLNIDFQHIELTDENQNLEKEYKSKTFYKTAFFKRIIFKFFNFINKIKKNNDALIVSSGTPFIYEKLLELSFFQLPKKYEFKKIISNIYDKKIRTKIKSKLRCNHNSTNLENFIRCHLHEFLPMCLIENFRNFYEECEKYYPKNPKFILTALEYDYNEIFKFYTAKRVTKGTPYFIIQHGNANFTHDYTLSRDITLSRSEYETATKFLTFGYSKNSFFKPLGNIKTIGKKCKYDKKGKLNFIAQPMLGLFFPYDANHEFLKSFELIRDFEKKLPKHINEKITLRLHPNFSTKRGNWFKKIYLNNFSNHKVDNGSQSYNRFLSQGRFNLFFYDCSGMLENFHYKVPTLAIWTDKKKFCYNHINDEFIEKYELLKESGILFDDLDELKIHIEKYWYNVDDWWLSQKTQNCIKKFNKDFNNKINFNSLFTLRKIINENI